jgi:hypothetical protein
LVWKRKLFIVRGFSLVAMEEKQEKKDKFDALRKEVQELKDKYIFLLENMVKLQSQEKWKVPEQVPKPESSISNLQMLLLLKESRATSRQFAVTAKQLKDAYNINKTERTVRNKLNYLELHNFVASFGKKPKAYFVTPSGLSMIKEQTRGSLDLSGKY